MPKAPYQMMRRLVRALRIQNGLTQEALAEKAGLDYKHFQLFELDRTKTPDLRTLERLARVLGVKAWVLLCDDVELIQARTGLEVSTLTGKTIRKSGRPPRASVRSDNGISAHQTRRKQ